MTPVQAAVAEYLAHGWKLCAINPGKKGPLYEGWNTPGQDIREPGRFPPGWGVGLLHAVSGTCTLDIDQYPEALESFRERGIDLDALYMADDSVRIISGRPNSGKLLFMLPEPRVSVQVKVGERVAFELRCSSATGNSVQDVLPPSQHVSSGKAYAWDFGAFAHWSNPPPLPAALAALWDELRRPATPEGPALVVPTGAASSKIEQWLKLQDPSGSYGEWLAVGMKLHGEFQGSSEGFGVWQRWSSASPKWDDKARAEMYPKWKGFKLEGPALVTIAKDLRQLPAEADEFMPVDNDSATSPQVATPVSAAELAGIVDAERPDQRANRELMQDRLVYLTNGKPRYWLRGDHKLPRIPEIDSLADSGMDADAVRNVFEPFMAPEPTGPKGTMVLPDPVYFFRRQKWKNTVKQIGFHPGEGTFYNDPVDGGRYLNSYINNRPEPIPMPPDIAGRFHWLLGRVTDQDFAPWLLNFYAHAVQFPGVKIQQAPLLFGDPGSGKSTLMDQLPALLFGRKYVKQITHDVLLSRFYAEALVDAWFVTLNELKMSGDSRVDRSYVSEKLKPLITEPMVVVERKGLAVYEIPNRVQVTASSNKDDALHIEDAESERRWAIAELRHRLTQAEIDKYIVPVYAAPLSANWFTDYFLGYKIDKSFSAAGRPPATPSKDRMAEISLGTWESRILERMESNAAPFDRDIVTALEVQELLRGVGHPSWSKAGSILRSAPFRALEKRTDTARYWAWRRQEFWTKLPATAWRDYHTHGVVPAALLESDLLGDING